MIVISPSELRGNQKKYFDLAEKERVVVKRGNKLIELVVNDSVAENPSPSNDPWFSNPDNMEELERRIKEHKEGKSNAAITLKTTEDIKNFIKNL